MGSTRLYKRHNYHDVERGLFSPPKKDRMFQVYLGHGLKMCQASWKQTYQRRRIFSQQNMYATKKIRSIESRLFIRDPYFMVYEISLYHWVGFHPLYTLHNEIFVHVKRVLRSPQQHVPPWKWMVGILVSFWDGLFSGLKREFQGVLAKYAKSEC